MKKLKIACAQMEVKPFEIEKNLVTMCNFINEARDNDCDIVAFPEMCISGYLLGDTWCNEEWCNTLMSCNDNILRFSKDIVIIYGNIYIDYKNVNKDGRTRKYNAAYVVKNGERFVKNGLDFINDSVATKTLLPNYRIFDDERYFFSTQEQSLDLNCDIKDLLKPFKVKINDSFINIGVEICEDLWFNDYKNDGKSLNVTKILIENGADVIINLSASPWTFGKDIARNNRIKDAYKECFTLLPFSKFVPFFYVNCCGVQNNGKNIVTFDGGTTVYNEDAEIIQKLQTPYVPSILIHDTSVKYLPIKTTDISRIEQKYQAIIQGIKGLDDIIGNSNFPYIVGLSGGIDSAVVACLLEQAVGYSRVRLFNLPLEHNGISLITCAYNIAKALIIPLETIPIQDLVEENLKLVEYLKPSELNKENVQAKIRGTSILSNIAGILNGVMTCNGNKVEIALGYATLYGDINGAIAPIGDLLKTEVFELAKFLNEEIYHREVIPNSLLPDEYFGFFIPPSAELKQNQKDPMKWGYHDALISTFTDYKKVNFETICDWYLNKTICKNLHISEELFRRYELHIPKVFIDDIEWIVTSMNKAIFKRIQSPPIIVLSKGAYGYDIRESQQQTYFSESYKLKRNLILNSGNSLWK